MVQWIRTHIDLAEDRSLVPSTHVSDSQSPEAQFHWIPSLWPLKIPVWSAHTHTQTYTYIYVVESKIFSKLSYWFYFLE